MFRKKIKAILISFTFLIILGLVVFLNLKNLLPSLSQSPFNRGKFFKKPTAHQEDWHLVTKIIDGDTIEVDGNQRIRLLAMNTEEIYFDNPSRAPSCRGLKARDRLKNLILGKRVVLEKDEGEEDKYERTLAYVYFEDKMINLLLVREGWADVMLIKPNLKYQKEFIIAQIEAKTQQGKIKKACPIKTCKIKGNINKNGEKTYYPPGSSGYQGVQINYQQGENWFCNEKEAQNMGFYENE